MTTDHDAEPQGAIDPSFEDWTEDQLRIWFLAHTERHTFEKRSASDHRVVGYTRVATTESVSVGGSYFHNSFKQPLVLACREIWKAERKDTESVREATARLAAHDQSDPSEGERDEGSWGEYKTASDIARKSLAIDAEVQP